MRRFLFVLASWWALFLPTRADEFVVGEIRGSGPTTTGIFKVHDKWEVRWNARQVVSVAVMASDGTIVAGAAGVLRGSLFIPLGGRYYFKVSDGTNGMPSDLAATESPFSWHLQVVEVGSSVPAAQALTVYTPYFVMPDAAIAPAPAAPPEPPPPTMTEAQSQALVVLKGDSAQGFGFLVRSPEGTFVATHLSLLANNPNVKILSETGAVIQPLSLKAATDRDLVFFAIKDNNYSYLPQSMDATADVVVGDRIMVPDASQTPITGEPGKVFAVTPDRIEYADITRGKTASISPFGVISPSAVTDMINGANSGNSGMPVIHGKTGKALAVLTAEKRVDLTDNIAKAWGANPAPGAAGIVPFYGLRLTGISKWEMIDLPRFLSETAFLKQFHLDTRALDSYLNGRKFSVEGGAPDNKFFLGNAKVHAANDTYKHLASDADHEQRMEAARELGSDLLGLADADLAKAQSPDLYLCTQFRFREELAYRKALRDEIEDLSNNPARLDNIARLR